MLNLNALLLSDQVKITRVMNAVAAGQTEQPGSSVNMAGYDGVVFLAGFGALTNGHVTGLKAQQSSDDGSADNFSDLAGSLASLVDGDSNKLLAIDIFRPEKQYLRPDIVRGTQNAVIDFVIAIQYASKEAPLTQGTTIKALKQLVTPAEGTA